MRHFNAVRILWLGGCLSLAITRPGYSEPITGPAWDVQEGPTWFKAVFESGPVNGTEPYEFTSTAPYVSPSGYWMIFNLEVYEEDKSIYGIAGDGVSIDVDMQHIKGPHPPETTGSPVHMDWSFEAGADPDPIEVPVGMVPHAGAFPGSEWVHWDTYKGTVTVQVNAEKTDILGYTITLEGAHVVPAPSTLVGLVGMGLVGVLRYSGRRRKWAV